MATDVDPLRTDARFFESLVAGDTHRLDAMLGDDFVIVDVMAGSEVDKTSFVGALADGQLAFEAISPSERSVRRYGDTAIVNGRTAMRGSFAGNAFAASSRYTHVFIARDDRWQLVSAQGTPIVE